MQINTINVPKKIIINSNSTLDSEDELEFNAREHIGLDDDDDIPTGDGVTVAVLDTGIYPNHSVFTENGTKHWNERIIAFYDEDEEVLIDDPYDVSWHGTWTASILGGNNTEYQGVAPGVDLVIMKIFELDDDELESSVSKIEDAVDWIIDNADDYDIKVVSMSFGAQYEGDESYDETKELNDIVEELTIEDILVVAASGNYGGSGTTDGVGSVTSPGSAPSVLTVGGVEYDGDMFDNSGEGPTYENLIKPDVCAPAVDVEGAEPGPPNDVYDDHTGTSASTPYVSGLAALLLEEDDDLDAMELKSIISMTSYRTFKPKTIHDNTQGWGIVQGYAALDALDKKLDIKVDTEIEFSLDDEESVYCQPISLKGFEHYFFELNQLDNAEAEMYLFDSEPDVDGNPILISNSIGYFPSDSYPKTMGVFLSEDHDYFLIIKLIHDSGKGDFIITITFDYRLSILGIFAGVNTISLVFIVKQMKNRF